MPNSAPDAGKRVSCNLINYLDNLGVDAADYSACQQSQVRFKIQYF